MVARRKRLSDDRRDLMLLRVDSTISAGHYGPEYDVRSPSGVILTGMIDLFHFAPNQTLSDDDFLQITSDPVGLRGDTWHARIWPDGKTEVFSE